MNCRMSLTARRGGLLLLAWLGCALVTPLAAQSLPELLGVPEEPVVEEAPPVVVLHSPRAAMKRFYSSMRRHQTLQSYKPEDLELALSALDLRGVESSAEQALELSKQFYEVLSRFGDFDLEQIPESVVEAHYTYTCRESPPLTGSIDIDFERIGGGSGSTDPENWRIAKTTVANIGAWWKEFEDRQVVESASDLSDEDKQQASATQLLGLELERSVPEGLRGQFFLLKDWQWLALALVSIFGVLLGRIVSFFMRRFSTKLGSSTKLEIDKSVLVGFERPFSLFVMVWMVLFARPVLRLEQSYADVLDLACALFLGITGVWSAYRLVDVVACMMTAKAKRTANRFDDMLVPLVRRSAKVFLAFVGVVYVASKLADDLYGIVAGLSIGSLALGFAAKDSIENLFGTVTVLLDKPYQLGDWVTVGDIDGSVEQVGFRSTKIRTFYNSVITVPNSRFIAAHVDNMGARRYRRIKTMISLSYGTPPMRIEAFCEAVRELIRKHPYTRKDYYHVYLNELGASSLDVLLYCFVLTPDWSTELREKHRLYLDILKVAEGLGVEIAFPTQTIHLAKDTAPLEPLADDTASAERMGRELADLIVRDGLERFEGERPGPVVID